MAGLSQKSRKTSVHTSFVLKRKVSRSGESNLRPSAHQLSVFQTEPAHKWRQTPRTPLQLAGTEAGAVLGRGGHAQCGNPATDVHAELTGRGVSTAVGHSVWGASPRGVSTTQRISQPQSMGASPRGVSTTQRISQPQSMGASPRGVSTLCDQTSCHLRCPDTNTLVEGLLLSRFTGPRRARL